MSKSLHNRPPLVIAGATRNGQAVYNVWRDNDALPSFSSHDYEWARLFADLAVDAGHEVHVDWTVRDAVEPRAYAFYAMAADALRF